MPSPHELEQRFWKALKSDMTMMLGLVGIEDGHTRPMTAQIEEERGPIWFFTAKDTALVEGLSKGRRAIATFTSKGHDLFATVHGGLRVDNDRAVIDRLWNPFGALSDTLSFVFNSPYTLGDKIMGLMAQFGFKKEEKEREAAKPEEHRTNGNANGSEAETAASDEKAKE